MVPPNSLHAASVEIKKRFAIVGAGGRAPMFIDPIAKDYRGHCELVGICDVSQTRMQWHQQRLMREYGYRAVPLFGIAEYERMISTTRPDTVIVCTPDATHHEYIIRALGLGCDVLTEKPMTTEVHKCQAIFEAVKRTGKKVQVAFNYRWGNGATQLHEVLRQQAIGRIISINFEYMLNTRHGADYFRRWHSDKTISGGLLVHKATHHFDLINWWIDSIPAVVYAQGRLAFYGRDNAAARGDLPLAAYARYTGSDCGNDPFALKLTEGALRSLYLDAEAETGYIRDKNVFREGITIEDTMVAIVKYRNNAHMTYSLNAFCPNEGFRVTMTGDRGRLEYEEDHGSHIITGGGEGGTDRREGGDAGHSAKLVVMPHFRPSYSVPIPKTDGAHGGGDAVLQEQLFSSNPPQDAHQRAAGHEQGAASILTGLAANESIRSGLPVRVEELFSLRPECNKLSELV